MISSTAKDNPFDTIVVGSGMGGLATASLLAQVGGQRVLVLESHFKLGGFLHSFRRKDFEWDPGFHYSGEMYQGSMTRKFMDLVTGGEVDWYQMSSPFEKVMFPEGVFDVPDCPKLYQEQLCDRFPKEAKNIRRYFRDIDAVQKWSQRWFFSKQLPSRIASVVSFGRSLVNKKTKEYMDGLFDDELLKGLLSAQWGDYGTRPSESSFGVHAIVSADYRQGGYYPVGGSQRIADSAVRQIESHGGRCLASHAVEEILIQGNRAVGVRVRHRNQTQEYFAKNVVSSAGIATTFNKLVPQRHGKVERERISAAELGTSALVVYLGLNDDPRKHGFTDCNYWMFESSDQEQNAESPTGGLLLSFGSLRSPGQEPHTAQIVTLSYASEWAEFENTEWKKRGDDYEQRKEACMDVFVDFAEERLPGLKKLIAYREMSSPLTIKSFTGHKQGQIYGRPCTPERLAEGEFFIGTSVKRLYLTGTDVTVPGVNSALMIGVMTAAKLLGFAGMPRVLSKASKSARSQR